MPGTSDIVIPLLEILFGVYIALSLTFTAVIAHAMHESLSVNHYLQRATPAQIAFDLRIVGCIFFLWAGGMLWVSGARL